MNILKGYKNNVDYLASTKSTQRFKNGGPDHGKIVLKNIFKYSDSDAYVLAEGLNSELCKDKDYINTVEYFVTNKGHKLNVILNEKTTQKELDADTLLNKILEIRKKYPSFVDIRTIKGDILSGGKPIHFTTTDRSYRLEYDTKDKKANCCFNDEDFSTKLISLFHKVKAKAIPCKLEPIS